MKNLKGKTAVITGAGSGIGKSVALALAHEGCNIAINDLVEKNLLILKAEIESKYEIKIFAKGFDVSEQSAWETFAEEMIKSMGPPDIVVNNAGIALGSFTIQSLPIEKMKRVMDVNYWGMVFGTKVFLPHLISKKESCVANVSSVFGFAGIANQGAYCSSKFAIRGFTETLRMEAMIHYPHLNILSIHPGGIDTNISKSADWEGSGYSEEIKQQANKDYERVLKANTPDQAAKSIVRAIKRTQKRLIIGMDGWLLYYTTKWFPISYSRILLKTVLKNIKTLSC